MSDIAPRLGSDHLPAYTAFAYKMLDLRSATKSVAAMVRALQCDPELRAARFAARDELQHTSDRVAGVLGMPAVPVRLSLRKRIRLGGLAIVRGNAATEIRLFPLWGVENKKHRDWQPAEIGLTSPVLACEILLHEIAHVHQYHFECIGDHERSFVKSYLAVERVMLALGFRPLLPQEFRLCGCPARSLAASLQGTPRPGKSFGPQDHGTAGLPENQPAGPTGGRRPKDNHRTTILQSFASTLQGTPRQSKSLDFG